MSGPRACISTARASCEDHKSVVGRWGNRTDDVLGEALFADIGAGALVDTA